MVEINQAIKRNGEVPEDIKLKSLRKLFIGGLSAETDREALVAHFCQYGQVANAYVIYDPLTKQSKSKRLSPDFGYVEFQNPEAAAVAVKANDHFINGKKASVQFFKTKETQTHKKVVGVQDKGKQEEAPAKDSNLGSRQPFGQVGRAAQQTENCGPYGYQHQNPELQYLVPNRLPHTSSFASKRHAVVKPTEPRVLVQGKWFSEFYQSLTRIDHERHLTQAHAPEGLRFNIRTSRHY